MLFITELERKHYTLNTSPIKNHTKGHSCPQKIIICILVGIHVFNMMCMVVMNGNYGNQCGKVSLATEKIFFHCLSDIFKILLFFGSYSFIKPSDFICFMLIWMIKHFLWKLSIQIYAWRFYSIQSWRFYIDNKCMSIYEPLWTISDGPRIGFSWR